MDRRAAAMLLTFALCCEAHAGKGFPAVKPLDAPMALDGSFGFTSEKKKPEKQAEDILERRLAASGIVCPKPPRCLIVFDEGREARFAQLTEDRYAPEGGPIVLSTKSGEIDAEGAAIDQGYVYVVGSHARKRKRCEDNPASRALLRLKVDPATGGVEGPGEPGALAPIIAATGLRAHLGKCVGTLPPEKDAEDTIDLQGQRGVDIEGIAAKHGRLYLGFRSPAEGGFAKILRVDAKAAFPPGVADALLHAFDVEVGERRGVRDMAAVEGGLLLLVGPDDDVRDADPKPWPSWRVLFWDGEGRTTRPVAELELEGVEPRADVAGCADDNLKPEGMAVMRETPQSWRIAVLSDGLCDGGPMWFDLTR